MSYKIAEVNQEDIDQLEQEYFDEWLDTVCQPPTIGW